MKSQRSIVFAAAPAGVCLAALMTACTAAFGSAGSSASSLLEWSPSGDAWRTDPAWNDGQAEKCVYRATRTIYEKPRSYRAFVYTNKEKIDPGTTVKTVGDSGNEVFKHHWSEIVPTENYEYRFSTSVNTLADNLAAYKLTASTQEDCGASFKLVVRQGTRGSSFDFFDSVYFPGAGQRITQIHGASMQFEDALPILLRDFPFDAPEECAFVLLPSQKETRQVPLVQERVTVSYVGRETLDLPAGKLDAHHLRVVPEAGARVIRGADFWFAADGRAPWLHALVQYKDPKGTSYELESLTRTAYWER